MLISYKNKALILLADTHGRHRRLELSPCDVLVHCGDVCNDGNDAQLSDFFEWFALQKAQYKVFVAGNHDYPFVFEPTTAHLLLPKNIIWLHNQVKTLAGLSFYGLDSHTNMFDMPDIATQKIDFVLSHVPPQKILDKGLGCPILAKFILLQKPAYHVFGHAHIQGKKTQTKNNTLYINASVTPF